MVKIDGDGEGYGDKDGTRKWTLMSQEDKLIKVMLSRFLLHKQQYVSLCRNLPYSRFVVPTRK